jgi:hypothetical protein
MRSSGAHAELKLRLAGTLLLALLCETLQPFAATQQFAL